MRGKRYAVAAMRRSGCSIGWTPSWSCRGGGGRMCSCVTTGEGSGPVSCINMFFFFQAEDGIRDLIVTGVQTCALPICEILSNFPRPTDDLKFAIDIFPLPSEGRGSV